MRYLRLLVPMLVWVIMASSCEKDPELIIEPDPSSITFNIYPKVGNQPMVLNQEYLDEDSYRIMPTLFRFYVSHLTLLTDSGELEIKDVALLSLEGLASGEPLTIEAAIPAGNYTGVRFWIGLDSAQNASDPATYAQDHPLSAFQGTFWTWNSGYRFVMLEGYYDTLANTPGPVATTSFFNYHTGLNTLYREAVLGAASVPFSVGEGDSYTYNLDLDLNRALYGSRDISRNMGAITHSTSNYQLAEDFTENFIRAFSLSNP